MKNILMPSLYSPTPKFIATSSELSDLPLQTEQHLNISIVRSQVFEYTGDVSLRAPRNQE